MRQAHSPTFGNKTANIYVKTNQFTTVCKDDVMISVLYNSKNHLGNLRWGCAYGVLTSILCEEKFFWNYVL